MSATHVYDETGKLRGCSTASDMCDYQGCPIDLGLCEHHDEVVDVPMPAITSGWRIEMDFRP